MTREARDLKRNVRVDTDIAVLGDAQGNTTQHLPLGLIRVRRRTGAGLGTVEIIRAFGGSAYPLIPGCEVHIGRDLGGRLAVLGATYEWMVANGFDPNYLNGGNPRYDWVDLRNAIPLRSSATQPPSLKVSIWPLRWIDHDKVVHEFPGGNLDISSDIPAVGNHGLIVTYIKSDDTAGYTASTPKALPESVNPIVLADIQECVTAAPDDAIWSGIWYVKNDQGQVTANDLYDDLRQWINVPGVSTITPGDIDLSSLADGILANDAGALVSLKHNLIATTDPGANDDGTQGYSIRSFWLNTTTGITYEAASIATGSAVWNPTNSYGLLQDNVGTPQPIRKILRISHSVSVQAIMSDFPDRTNLSFNIPTNGITNSMLQSTAVTDSKFSGTLTHEKGGLEADVSAVNGLLGITGGVTFAEALPLGTNVGGLGADVATNNEGDTLLSNGANGSYVTSPLPPGMRNHIIDPMLDYWPDGTSFTDPANLQYLSVNTFFNRATDGGTLNVDVTREAFTLGQTDVPGHPRYFMRLTGSVEGSPGGSEYVAVNVPIEYVRTLNGLQANFSLYLKGGAAGTTALAAAQSFGTGGTPSSAVFVTGFNVAITTSWVRYDVTLSLPSVSGKTLGTDNNDFLNLWIYKQAGATVAAARNLPGAITFTNTLDIACMQLAEGGIRTAFELRPKTFEQRLIERFHWRNPGGSAGTQFANTANHTTTVARGALQFPTEMRRVPTFSSSGNFRVFHANTSTAITSLTSDLITTMSARLNGTVASGLTVGQASVIMSNSDGAAQITYDARL